MLKPSCIVIQLTNTCRTFAPLGSRLHSRTGRIGSWLGNRMGHHRHASQEQIAASRQDIANILEGKDHRLLVVCGPCSIHDTDAALDYARRLQSISAELRDQLYIVMRVYFEKPRTTVGWKGLINDPHMDGSFDVEAGFIKARELLLNLVEMGLPLATEALDPNSPQFLGDLFSWSAIGARTTESQIHREMASGLDLPVGFKNGTDGGVAIACYCSKAVARVRWIARTRAAA